MINSVCLIGYLAADPEIKATPNGTKIAKMRLAVNEVRYNRQSNEKTVKTHWFTLSAWDRLADTCERLLKKGTRLAVRGSLDYQEWTRKEGGKANRIEIRIRDMEILTPRGEARSDQFIEKSDAQPFPGPAPSEHAAAEGEENFADPDFAPMSDDDIPF
jgi:single-strand DNA-binding protein